ncbi:MAG TPA: non-homologous end-joining DNA ligase [Candidatus Binatia bacterium]|jgi:bifunctional non-homologous end joining protein LigD
MRKKNAEPSADRKSAVARGPNAENPSPAAKKKATRNYHPATYQPRAAARPKSLRSDLVLPRDRDTLDIRLDGKTVHLTNLRKLFWPDLGITKGDLCQFYIDVADALLPHLAHRAMVMKRYPHGAAGEFFFMKRAPESRPEWIETCAIEHSSGNIINFPVIGDLASLLWVINLGCIDLNQWYARCDDVDRPDYLHFDLDPVKEASWEQVCETASMVHNALTHLKLPSYIKTTGSRGFHIYVPIVRGPNQREVWTVAKKFANALAALRPDLITAEYKVAKRPGRRVLVDYNQNAWGHTLASIYSVRPQPRASVSTPITWEELQNGVRIEDFRIDNVPERVRKVGDLWAPLLRETGKAKLERLYEASA